MNGNAESSKFDPESLFPLARDQATAEKFDSDSPEPTDHRFVLDATPFATRLSVAHFYPERAHVVA